jgi:hypothetical protein
MTKRTLEQSGKEEKTTIDLLLEADSLCIQLEAKLKTAINELLKEGADPDLIKGLLESLSELANNRSNLDYHRKRLEDLNSNNNNNPSPKI